MKERGPVAVGDLNMRAATGRGKGFDNPAASIQVAELFDEEVKTKGEIFFLGNEKNRTKVVRGVQSMTTRPRDFLKYGLRNPHQLRPPLNALL